MYEIDYTDEYGEEFVVQYNAYVDKHYSNLRDIQRLEVDITIEDVMVFSYDDANNATIKTTLKDDVLEDITTQCFNNYIDGLY